MSVKKILLYPDPRLLNQAKEIEKIDFEVEEIAKDLIDTMYSAEGVGLAAPQIGISKRIFVMDCHTEKETKEYLVAINPIVIKYSKELKSYKEGCLSIPDITEEISRPETVEVSYHDLSGKLKKEKLQGLWATCFQHELDHLNGKLFIDYLKPVKRALVKNKIKKLNKNR